jgi:hypothetical protein
MHGWSSKDRGRDWGKVSQAKDIRIAEAGAGLGTLPHSLRRSQPMVPSSRIPAS